MQANIKGLVDRQGLSRVKAIDAESLITPLEVQQQRQAVECSLFTIEWELV